MAWFLKALVYWGHDLESDITRSAISHVIDNQNDDGSWGDTKGTKGNAIHTTRMLESFSLLFRRHHISQSFFEAIMPHVKVEYLTLSIEDQVAANVRTEKRASTQSFVKRNRKSGALGYF